MEMSFNQHSSLYEETYLNPLYFNSSSPAAVSANHSPTNCSMGTPPAHLQICNNPQSKFRFRYAVEMNGALHGCLMAESADGNKKKYIQVQLKGCLEKEAIIRCSLVTNSLKPIPHVHYLSGHNSDHSRTTENLYHDVLVSDTNNWTAKFSGLTIVRITKKQVREVIEKRMRKEYSSNGVVLNRNQEKQLKDEAASIANTMDLHCVKLKFESLLEKNGSLEAITLPVYSTPIYNQKTSNVGDLKIARIDKVTGSCSGHEEVFIFVEQVNKKDIKIRFFETDENDVVTWSAFADFTELDVHHQYAIAFRTPPYRDQNIQSAVPVQFQLYRPSNEDVSEPKLFTYTPRESIVPGVKRQRHEEPTFVNSPSQHNRPYHSEQTVARTTLLHMNVPHNKPEVTSVHPPSTQYDQREKSSFSGNENPRSDSRLVPSLDQELASFDLSKYCFDQEVLQFLNEDYWLTDGPSSSEDLHKKRTESLRIKAQQTSLSSKPTTDVPFTWSSAMLSKYAVNMTKALRCFVETGDISAVLVRMQHLLAIQCERGNNALHDAVVHNQINVVRSMLRACQNLSFINARNNSNQSPLHVAVMHKRGEAVALLLNHGADPNFTDSDGNNAFHIAARGRFECLKLLLKLDDKAAQISARNYSGLTPLHIAIKAEDIRSVELLCSRSDVNCYETKQGRSPLQLAIMTNNLSIVNQLLQNPLVDVNSESYDGTTALHLAAMCERDDFCTMLIEHGANPVDHLANSEDELDDDSDVEDEDDHVERVTDSDEEKVLAKSSNLMQTNTLILNNCSETPKSTKKHQDMDSGVDLLASKELTYELDGKVIAQLAEILDTPSKEWAKLADSFGMLKSMETVLVKQASPTTYLLENLDLWEVPIQKVAAKFREHNLNRAADILDDYILHSYST